MNYVLTAWIAVNLAAFIHELGHFIAAKWMRLDVFKFSIGFGPALIKYRKVTFQKEVYHQFGSDVFWRKSDRRITGVNYGDYRHHPKVSTTFQIGIIPILASVDIRGYDWLKDYGDKEFTSFSLLNLRRRLFVIGSGMGANLIWAIAVMTIFFCIGTHISIGKQKIPSYYIKTSSGVVIGTVTPGSLADEYGIAAGDKILKINGRSIYTTGTARTRLNESALNNEVIRLSLMRNDYVFQYSFTPAEYQYHIINQQLDLPVAKLSHVYMAIFPAFGFAVGETFVFLSNAFFEIPDMAIRWVHQGYDHRQSEFYTRVFGKLDKSMHPKVYIFWLASLTILLISLLPLPGTDGSRVVALSIDHFFKTQTGPIPLWEWGVTIFSFLTFVFLGFLIIYWGILKPIFSPVF